MQHLDAVSTDPQIEETNPSNVESPQNTNEEVGEPSGNGETPESAEAKAILDLTKAEKFTFEGKEWTPDELKKAVMLQSDYTKKTQALAEDRKTYESFKEEKKYYDNLSVDLEAVRNNPQLAEAFRQTYPEKFHGYLQSLGIQSQQQPGPNVQQSNLPSEVLREIQALKENNQQFTDYMTQKERETFDAKIDAIESDLSKKYTRANLTDVYGVAKEFLDENNLDPKSLDAKMLEPFFKASHEYNVGQYKAWQKEELERAKSLNKEGSDIGRGGGVPGGAPERLNLNEAIKRHIEETSQ